MNNFLSEDIFQRINENPNTPFFMRQAFNFHDIVNWKDLENYLNNPYIHSADIQIIGENNIKITPTQITFPYCVEPKVIPTQIFELIKKGYSFVLLNMTRFNKKLNTLAKEIEDSFFSPILLDFHLYCGLYSDCKSFTAHADESYNIIMQVEGTSRWIVYDNVYDQTVLCSGKFEEKNLRVLFDEMISPGDTLYIPKGFVHKCIPQGKRISISSCWQYPSNLHQITLDSYYSDRIWHTFT